MFFFLFTFFLSHQHMQTHKLHCHCHCFSLSRGNHLLSGLFMFVNFFFVSSSCDDDWETYGSSSVRLFYYKYGFSFRFYFDIATDISTLRGAFWHVDWCTDYELQITPLPPPPPRATQQQKLNEEKVFTFCKLASAHAIKISLCVCPSVVVFLAAFYFSWFLFYCFIFCSP